MIRPESAWTIAYLTVLVAMGQMSTGIYLPSMPSLAAVFVTDSGTVKLTMSVFLAGFAVAQLIYGPLCDRYGRRPVVIGGLAIFALASLACALAPSIEWLIAARLFQAIGACSGQVLGRAIGRDLFEGQRYAKVMALVGLALALTPAAGPVLGGVLSIFNVLGYAVGSAIANKASGRVAAPRMVAIGALVVLLSGGAMIGFSLAGFVTAYTLIGPMMVMLTGIGMLIPNAMAGAIGPFPAMAGVASALMGFLQMAMAMVMSVLVGLLQAVHDMPMPIVFALSALLTFASYLALVRGARPEAAHLQ